MNTSGKIGLALGVVAIAVAGGSTAYLLTRDPFLASCEEALQSRLRSPSTYQRISVSALDRRSLTLDEYRGGDSPRLVPGINNGRLNASLTSIFERQTADFERTGMDSVFIEIEYDAANGFGTPIRARVTCDVFRAPGEPVGNTYSSLVQIDGETNLGWSMRLSREAEE